jgi:hypothetical protein
MAYGAVAPFQATGMVTLVISTLNYIHILQKLLNDFLHHLDTLFNCHGMLKLWIYLTKFCGSRQSKIRERQRSFGCWIDSPPGVRLPSRCIPFQSERRALCNM